MQEEIDKNKQLAIAVGKVINKLRNHGSFSCNELGNQYDINDKTIGNIEKGRVNVKLVTLWRLAEALDIDMSELIRLIKAELPPGFKLMDE